MLIEALMSIGITGLIMIVLVSITVFSGRSFVALANYVELDDKNRIAIDTITRDLRACNRVFYNATNFLALEDSDGFFVYYIYSPTTKAMTRYKASQVSTLLTGCDSLTFNLGKRNTAPGTLDQYPAATVAEAKVVDVSWKCSRTILGVNANTESVQTAKIVIRKQGT
jgi:Tfp pilus assembly protein PilW